MSNDAALTYDSYVVLGYTGENASGIVEYPEYECLGYTGAIGSITFASYEVESTVLSNPLISGVITFSSQDVYGTCVVGVTCNASVSYSGYSVELSLYEIPTLAGAVVFPTHEIDGYVTIPSSHLGVRLNTVNFAPSQYSNFLFNSGCVFNGKILFAGTSGIFTHDGDSDSAVDIYAYFRLPSFDLQTQKQKSFRKVFLEGLSTGNISVAPVIDGVIGTAATVDSLGTAAETQYTIPMNHADRGTLLSLQVANIGGADFTINSIDATVVVANTLSHGYSILGRAKFEYPSAVVAASAS